MVAAPPTSGKTLLAAESVRYWTNEQQFVWPQPKRPEDVIITVSFIQSSIYPMELVIDPHDFKIHTLEGVHGKITFHRDLTEEEHQKIMEKRRRDYPELFKDR